MGIPGREELVGRCTLIVSPAQGLGIFLSIFRSREKLIPVPGKHRTGAITPGGLDQGHRYPNWPILEVKLKPYPLPPKLR